MKKVTASPIKARAVKSKRANTTVVNIAANIKGYPALATGKSVWFGESEQEKLLIKYTPTEIAKYY